MWLEVLDKVPKEGAMVAVVIEEKKLFIAMNNNVLYAAENRCPHEDIELTLGCLKGDRVKCSLHGYSFSLKTGEASEDDIGTLQVYPVKQDNNKVYIKL